MRRKEENKTQQNQIPSFTETKTSYEQCEGLNVALTLIWMIERPHLYVAFPSLQSPQAPAGRLQTQECVPRGAVVVGVHLERFLPITQESAGREFPPRDTSLRRGSVETPTKPPINPLSTPQIQSVTPPLQWHLRKGKNTEQ